MFKNCLKSGLICIVIGWQLVAHAERPAPVRFTTEIVGSIDEWRPVSGYVVVDGTRYSLDEKIEILTGTGEPVGLSAVEKGASAGVIEVDGKVRRLILY